MSPCRNVWEHIKVGEIKEVCHRQNNPHKIYTHIHTMYASGIEIQIIYLANIWILSDWQSDVDVKPFEKGGESIICLFSYYKTIIANGAPNAVNNWHTLRYA